MGQLRLNTDLEIKWKVTWKEEMKNEQMRVRGCSLFQDVDSERKGLGDRRVSRRIMKIVFKNSRGKLGGASKVGDTVFHE